jgi:threonine-phosphate decarboxylase
MCGSSTEHLSGIKFPSGGKHCIWWAELSGGKMMARKDFFIHGGNVYAIAGEKVSDIRQILDFSANINPLGLSVKVRQALERHLADVVNYPDSRADDLKKAISLRYQVATENITVGNGAVELIYVLCHMLRPRQILIPAPTFSEYERAGRAAGARIDYLYLRSDENFALDLAVLKEKIPQAAITFICNPNNPTGQLLPSEHLREIIATAKKHDNLVVVDESFLDFSAAADEYTCRPFLDDYDNLLILHSLTKFYAVPGLRLGFALTSPSIGAMLELGKDPWNVNTLAQIAGVAALTDEEYRLKSIEFIAAARRQLSLGLNGLPGVQAYSAEANFVLADIAGTGYDSGELRRLFAQQMILIRDCENYPGLSSSYIRLAVKLPDQNNRLLEVFHELLEGRDKNDKTNFGKTRPDRLE